MLYFDCQLDPVRQTEHLRGTRKSKQKKQNNDNRHERNKRYEHARTDMNKMYKDAQRSLDMPAS